MSLYRVPLSWREGIGEGAVKGISIYIEVRVFQKHPDCCWLGHILIFRIDDIFIRIASRPTAGGRTPTRYRTGLLAGGSLGQVLVDRGEFSGQGFDLPGVVARHGLL